MACVPDELWTDPTCIYLRKRRRRLWMLLCDMERLRQRWHADDVARWTVGVWAANLDVSEKRLQTDLGELRALGLVDPECIRLTFCRPAETSTEGKTKRHYPYPSDERRRSADTPQDLRNDSADTPQPTPQADESLAIAKLEAEAKLNEDISSLATAKPSRARPNDGDYPNRARPTSEEVCRLEQMGWTIEQIEHAIRVVAARPKFRGSAAWDKYLPKVLKDLYPPRSGQQSMPMLHSVPGGQSKPPVAASPPASPFAPPAAATTSGRTAQERCAARAATAGNEPIPRRLGNYTTPTGLSQASASISPEWAAQVDQISGLG